MCSVDCRSGSILRSTLNLAEHGLLLELIV